MVHRAQARRQLALLRENRMRDDLLWITLRQVASGFRNLRWAGLSNPLHEVAMGVGGVQQGLTFLRVF